VKQYFPRPQVLAGLFRVVETLFGVASPREAPVWHPDVRFFASRRRGQARRPVLPRSLRARRPSAAAPGWTTRSRRRAIAGGVQTPVAYLNCNFPAPVGGKPALFTHDDVITLFHEFGHGLHHLLTRVDELGVSGINGVEWDAVELPSQFMENFCWEWDVLRT
jgi:oligopeptidase A